MYNKSNLMSEVLRKHIIINSYESEIREHLNNNYEDIDDILKNANSLHNTYDDGIFWVLYEICINYDIAINKYIKTLNIIDENAEAVKAALIIIKKIKNIYFSKYERLIIIKNFICIIKYMKANRAAIVKLKIMNI